MKTEQPERERRERSALLLPPAPKTGDASRLHLPIKRTQLVSWTPALATAFFLPIIKKLFSTKQFEIFPFGATYQ
jgi:hypothetical protein